MSGYLCTKKLSVMMVYYHIVQDRGKYITFNVPGNLWEALKMSVNFLYYIQLALTGHLPPLFSFKVTVSHSDP